MTSETHTPQIRTYIVEVRQRIKVKIDAAKFDDRFMEEFRQSFYQFHEIDEHVKHLAQLEARGIAGDFIEGYGPAKDMGIELFDELDGIDMDIIKGPVIAAIAKAEGRS